jgi:hypothetical protein
VGGQCLEHSGLSERASLDQCQDAWDDECAQAPARELQWLSSPGEGPLRGAVPCSSIPSWGNENSQSLISSRRVFHATT